MREATFLKYFEKHARFFLEKKAITKKMIVQNLRSGECPSRIQEEVMLDGQYTFYLGKRWGKVAHRMYSEKMFVKVSDSYIPFCRYIKPMVKIVKGIRVR